MDEMAITEGRRKPVLATFRAKREEKKLPPANPDAFGKPFEDLDKAHSPHLYLHSFKNYTLYQNIC